MKKNIAALSVVLVLLLGLLAPAALADTTNVEVAPGYDYTRFKDDRITLNVYNWGEYISTGTDGESLDVNGAFEKLTGIKVNYTMFDTNEAMYAKLKSGGANYDVIIPSDYMIGKMIAEDMLAELNFANIPNYSMIGESYKSQAYDPDNRYSVPYTWGYVGIIYNTTMVDDVVDSWDILWDENYSGDILMFDNSRDAVGIALKKLGKSLNPANDADVDLAMAELAAQKPLVQAYVMDQIFDKMEGGEAALAPYYAGDAIQMIAENPDLAFAVPKEGTNYFVDAMCVPVDSANKEAAEMYINFLCETQVAMENSLFIGYSTPQIMAEAAMPEEVKDDPIAYPPESVLQNTETFTVLPQELNDHMDKAWGDMRSSSSSEGGIGWVIPVVLVAILLVVVLVVVIGKQRKARNDY
ncbi:MAG: ABC transporter substrate-binding protein [Ruminococcaceae bacterium]|nr:ABC transporter substrate-binding protein [Oscillospiraceae bacterium]